MEDGEVWQDGKDSGPLAWAGWSEEILSCKRVVVAIVASSGSSSSERFVNNVEFFFGNCGTEIF